MALGSIITGIFGVGDSNPVASTVERIAGVFAPNAERERQRAWESKQASLDQYGREFHHRESRTLFDSLVDGLNRLVRPSLVISYVFLVPFCAVMYPQETAAAIETLSALPEFYWLANSTIVLFFFGGRMQMKALEVKKQLKAASKTLNETKPMSEKLRDMEPDHPLVARIDEDLDEGDDNIIIQRWNESVK